jgi:hypothetical protein
MSTTTPALHTVRARAMRLPDDLPTVTLDHPYFEAAWLPTVGPTAWLLWRSIARRLAHDPHPTWDASDLARRHGVGPAVLVRSLDRLATFGVAGPDPDGTYAVPSACPPLWPSLLRRASAQTRRLHRQAFPADSS